MIQPSLSTSKLSTAPFATCGLLVLLLSLATSAQADDWPQWRGPKRDGVWRETGLLEKSGTWFIYISERIGQGRENAKAYFKEHKDKAAELEAELRGKFMLPAQKSAISCALPGSWPPNWLQGKPSTVRPSPPNCS